MRKNHGIYAISGYITLWLHCWIHANTGLIQADAGHMAVSEAMLIHANTG